MVINQDRFGRVIAAKGSLVVAVGDNAWHAALAAIKHGSRKVAHAMVRDAKRLERQHGGLDKASREAVEEAFAVLAR